MDGVFVNPRGMGDGLMIRMDIQAIMVGAGPVSSLIVLRPRTAHKDEESIKLPIRIGVVEATIISTGIEGAPIKRPMTHDLLLSCIHEMGGSLNSVEIVDVRGTTFYARLNISCESGRHIEIDARPSDAIALAVRQGVPIFADEQVLKMATMPDFEAVERQEKEHEMEDFHDFVEKLSPEDFT